MGIGSPEGLLKLLGDDAGRSRRVLVELNETATLLRKGAQDGTRGLLPFVTGLFDNPPSARLPNSKVDVTATEPTLRRSDKEVVLPVMRLQQKVKMGEIEIH